MICPEQKMDCSTFTFRFMFRSASLQLAVVAAHKVRPTERQERALA